jgi:hypothetical protein
VKITQEDPTIMAIEPGTEAVTFDNPNPQHWRRMGGESGQWHLGEWLHGVRPDGEPTFTLCGRTLPDDLSDDERREGGQSAVGVATCNSCLNVYAGRIAD